MGVCVGSTPRIQRRISTWIDIVYTLLLSLLWSTTVVATVGGRLQLLSKYHGGCRCWDQRRWFLSAAGGLWLYCECSCFQSAGFAVTFCKRHKAARRNARNHTKPTTSWPLDLPWLQRHWCPSMCVSAWSWTDNDPPPLTPWRPRCYWCCFLSRSSLHIHIIKVHTRYERCSILVPLEERLNIV